jgi:hypothetical protein
VKRTPLDELDQMLGIWNARSRRLSRLESQITSTGSRRCQFQTEWTEHRSTTAQATKQPANPCFCRVLDLEKPLEQRKQLTLEGWASGHARLSSAESFITPQSTSWLRKFTSITRYQRAFASRVSNQHAHAALSNRKPDPQSDKMQTDCRWSS